MILSTCKAGDKIILPRNVHKSALNALVLCGAVPVYVNPEMNAKLGISLGMEIDQVARAIEDNPDAKAVLVNNPTYYGICSDLRAIVNLLIPEESRCLQMKHMGRICILGKTFRYVVWQQAQTCLPSPCTNPGEAFTQSSILLTGKAVKADHVRQIINLTQTTSASYLLLSSLDISRRNLALRGRESFARVAKMAEYARNEINSIGGYYAYGRDLVNGTSIYDYDVTKLSVYTLISGLPE